MEEKILNDNWSVTSKVSRFLIAGPAVQAVFLQLPLGWGHKSIHVVHAVLRGFFSH